jgi:PIN domain nuclease of toxin-antitoxin system
MSHLLDTHTLIWFLENDSRLPSIKANIGKLTLSFPFNTIAPNLITAGITQLPITFKDLEIYLSLPLHHRDPFDRLLIAQAINYSLIFISQDAQMDAYPIQCLWK